MNREIKGLIAFSTSRLWLSRLISKINTNMVYTSAFLVFGEIGGELIIGQPTELGIKLVPISNYIRPDTTLEIWEVDRDQEIKNASVKALFLDINKPRKWLKFFLILGLTYLGLYKKLLYSQYIYYYLTCIDYPLDIIPQEMTPDNIYDRFLLNQDCKKVAHSPISESKIFWLNKYD